MQYEQQKKATVSSRGDILVVDDEQSIAEFLAELLLDEGYAVRTAADGVQALQAITDRVPSLVLLDAMMPRMDGETVLQQLQTQGFAQLPVIMMSAGVDLTTFLQKGAIAVIAKPIHLDALLVLVTQHFDSRHMDNGSRDRG